MKPTFIIAEAGVNHNGDINQAIALIDLAVQAGADAVKFQTFKADDLVSKAIQQADYQTENTKQEQSQYALLKSLELSYDDHQMLIAHCHKQSIEFMSTPFDDDSIEMLNLLNMKTWKIPSGELLSIPYLRKIGKMNQTTILSTGMGNMEEVELAINTLLQAGLAENKLTVLHANTAYPTPFEDVNLNAMLAIKERFKVAVGLSDHSLGIAVPIAAVAMGASVIEKHFTLDKTLAGPDHKASLEPSELIAMVKAIREVEQALGKGVKQISPSEKPNKKLVRKRIVAKYAVEKGTLLTEQNIMLKRSITGLASTEWDKVIGSYAKQNYVAEDGIYFD